MIIFERLPPLQSLKGLFNILESASKLSIGPCVQILLPPLGKDLPMGLCNYNYILAHASSDALTRQ
jgi:hypothetical protein